MLTCRNSVSTTCCGARCAALPAIAAEWAKATMSASDAEARKVAEEHAVAAASQGAVQARAKAKAAAALAAVTAQPTAAPVRLRVTSVTARNSNTPKQRRATPGHDTMHAPPSRSGVAGEPGPESAGSGCERRP